MFYNLAQNIYWLISCNVHCKQLFNKCFSFPVWFPCGLAIIELVGMYLYKFKCYCDNKFILFDMPKILYMYFNMWDNILIGDGEPKTLPAVVRVFMIWPNGRWHGWSEICLGSSRRPEENLMESKEDTPHGYWDTVHRTCDLKPTPKQA